MRKWHFSLTNRHLSHFFCPKLGVIMNANNAKFSYPGTKFYNGVQNYINFFVVILLIHKFHRGNMRQPDMAFVLCQMSSHLQAGAGCSGTPYRNIKSQNSMRCRAFAG
jgi:hypothetical protein